MSTTTNTKTIREYPLPCVPEALVLELTGSWNILRVEARFGKPCLYILEDTTGKPARTTFTVVPTNQPVDTKLVTGANGHLGCYSVPGNMLHVFGPNSSK